MSSQFPPPRKHLSLNWLISCVLFSQDWCWWNFVVLCSIGPYCSLRLQIHGRQFTMDPFHQIEQQEDEWGMPFFLSISIFFFCYFSLLVSKWTNRTREGGEIGVGNWMDILIDSVLVSDWFLFIYCIYEGLI